MAGVKIVGKAKKGRAEKTISAPNPFDESKARLVTENAHSGNQGTGGGVSSDGCVAAHDTVFGETETTCTRLGNTARGCGIALGTENCGWTSARRLNNTELVAALAAGVQHGVDHVLSVQVC